MNNLTYITLRDKILSANREQPIRFCNLLYAKGNPYDYFNFAIITSVCGVDMLVMAAEDNTFCRAYPWRIDMMIEEVDKIISNYCHDSWHCGMLDYIVLCEQEE